MNSVAEMKITAIAPWFGSNRMQAVHVGAELGKLDWVGIAFAGGCCEIPYIHARTIVANDLHRHIINLARVMADPKLGPALYRKLRRYVLHPDALIVCQARCEMREKRPEQISEEPDLSWAEDYFVSAWMSRSHSAGSEVEFSSGISLRWNANGGDSAVRFFNAAGEAYRWRKCLRNTSFTTMDALQFSQKCKDEDGHGIYYDPPFPGPGDRYKFKVDEPFQRRLAEEAGRFRKARVVMRFYDHPLIRELYPIDKWNWRFFKGRNQANNTTPEVLLLNGPSVTEGLL